MYRNAFLPDPFLRKDGSRITSADQWPAQAAFIRQLAQEHMYGPWPGHPASVTVVASEHEFLYGGQAVRETVTLRVNDDFDLPVVFTRPAHAASYPVITFNAGFGFSHDCPIEETLVCQGGYGVAAFDRESIRPDIDYARHKGMLEQVQARHAPALACCTIMAWGWGHTIVADWLESRGDTAELICTGHSRGGKAALCAGIFDERFAVVAPIGSGAGGAGTARFSGSTDGSRQDEKHCETVGRITRAFPDWFNARYAAYGSGEAPHPISECEERLPLDAHMLRAACAPRAVFNSEGTDDHWANPFGAQLACEAADPVYALLGVPERNAYHIRPGAHAFNAHDWAALADFCDMVLKRPRHIPHDDTVVRWFDIDPAVYAPWIND